MDKVCSLKEVITGACLAKPQNCFILEGNTLYGEISRHIFAESKCISICDRMAYGKVLPEILSAEFIAERTKANCELDTSEKEIAIWYSENVVRPLEELISYPAQKIFAICFDGCLSEIWRLFIQGFIEKNTLANKIGIVKVSATTLNVIDVFEVDVRGSYDAFCRVACKRQAEDLSRFEISSEAVEFFLEVNNLESSLLSEYLSDTDFDSARWRFLKNDRMRYIGLYIDDFSKLYYNYKKIVKNA